MKHGTFVYMAAAAALMAGWSAPGMTMIEGIEGSAFSLTAQADQISTPEGGSIPIWGLANAGGRTQYPGPTLIVNQGDTITVDLTNGLAVPVSLVFPGQTGVTAVELTPPTARGVLTRDALPGGTVRYSFVAAQPGTYQYHSGTRPDLQIEMGMVGALIVRPAMGGMPMHMQAYHHPDSMYDVEYLFLETEMDPLIHQQVAEDALSEINNTKYWPTYWFLNGRCAPDTMANARVKRLPTQPYNCMPMMEPGQRMLMRIINAGRDYHPFHHHGNHAKIIARDGRLLSSGVGAGADRGEEVFTIVVPPGGTVDAIFTWTGHGLGWDMYGHASNDPDTLMPGEDPEDHGKPFPVVLPEKSDLTFGGMWSGSPYLSGIGSLPPGEGGMNPLGAYTFMWHSHTEKEMTNNDIFPGGMMTMMMVLPPGSGIPVP